jgi:hypothetical protein
MPQKSVDLSQNYEVTTISSADIVWRHVQFVSQTQERKNCLSLKLVNVTECYDSTALMKRQDKKIFLDWEIVMTQTSQKSPRV